VDLTKDILRLKKERNAVILAHNYQRPEIQDLGDFVGDSLELARKAQETDAKVIVFCGVDFMAETAAIINPGKTVLLPAWDAMCPMAAMLPPEVISKARKDCPDAQVVMYINTLAAAKAYADCICTSANAVKVVNSMESDRIIFAPDKNLAYHVGKNTDKEIIPVPADGICIVHDRITIEDVKRARCEHPDAILTVHPETPPEVQDIADHVGSTKQMIDFVKTSTDREFIIGTEVEIIHRMKKEAPGKLFYPACQGAVCRNMKKITLENLHEALKHMQYRIEVPEDIAKKARKPIERMLGLK